MNLEQTNLFFEEQPISPCLLSGGERAIFIRWTRDAKGKHKAEVARTHYNFREPRQTFLADPETVEFCKCWKVVVFDTETTGLPKSWKAPASDVENWPRLVEIAFTIADISFENQVEDFKTFEGIIQPEGFKIPERASDVHGITDEKALLEGTPISGVMSKFIETVLKADFLIAHNMKFDDKIVEAEMIRLEFESGIATISKIPKICTMMSSNKFVGTRNKRGGGKFPNLQELHQKIFGVGFDGAHRAGADTEATLGCFAGLLEHKQINLEEVVKKWL